MAHSVTEVSELQTYIQGIIERAEHHAGNVDEIALVLAGAIVWQKDDNPIKVMTKDGNIKNVLWVFIRGKRYAFSYNHQSDEIEMREKSIQGTVLHTFSNGTQLSEVKKIFQEL